MKKATKLEQKLLDLSLMVVRSYRKEFKKYGCELNAFIYRNDVKDYYESQIHIVLRSKVCLPEIYPIDIIYIPKNGKDIKSDTPIIYVDEDTLHQTETEIKNKLSAWLLKYCDD